MNTRVRILSQYPFLFGRASGSAASGSSWSCELLDSVRGMEAAIESPEWELCIFHWRHNETFWSIAAHTVLRQRQLGIEELWTGHRDDGSSILRLVRHSSVDVRCALEFIEKALAFSDNPPLPFSSDVKGSM